MAVRYGLITSRFQRMDRQREADDSIDSRLVGHRFRHAASAYALALVAAWDGNGQFLDNSYANSNRPTSRSPNVQAMKKGGRDLETETSRKMARLATWHSCSGLVRLAAGLQPTTMAPSLHPTSEHAENTASHFQSPADAKAALPGHRRS